MSILDDAIREHLELKRAHGADEGELKRLEDEAFGPPQRPDEIDPFSDAPTEFLLSPEETAAGGPEIGDEGERGGRRPNLTDLQEPPAEEADLGEEPTAFIAGPGPGEDEMPPPAPRDELAPPPDAPPPSPAEAAEAPPPPPVDQAPADLAPPTGEEWRPAREEHPAGEHELGGEAGPGPEERDALVDQPTQIFDVQAEMDAAAAAERESPTDEELVDAAQAEPQAAPPAPEPAPPAPEEPPPLESHGPDAEVAGHPPAEAAPEEESAEFDFFNEQRLSDELDRALEAPVAEEKSLPGFEDAAPAEGGIFDFESQSIPYEEDPSEEVLRRADAAQAATEESRPAPEPPTEAPRPTEEPPSAEAPRRAEEPPTAEEPRRAEEPRSEEPQGSAGDAEEEDDLDYDPETGHDDVLEDTPRFLEDQPEDDDLWFEQKPPKDFDLD